MQRQQIYSFSFLEWTFDDETQKESHKRITRGVMVTSERTRKGDWVFKTRTNWDDEATTQMVGDPLEGPDSTAQCTYFWNCMHYAAARCLVEELMEDALDHDFDFVDLDWPLPMYGDEHIDYFDILAKTLPKVKLKRVDNGYN